MKVAKQRQGHFAKYGRGVAPLLAQPYLFQHKNHCDLTLAFNADLKNEKTRPSKQCEFCNNPLDKYLIRVQIRVVPLVRVVQLVKLVQGGQGDPVGQSGQVVQLVMASLDDMHSENIWFTWSKPSDY